MRISVLAVVGVCACLRIFELLLARRNGAKIMARGGVRVEPDGMGAIAMVHGLWFAGLLAEELWIGSRAWPLWSIWLAGSLAVGAEVLRVACITVLGERWNTRVLFLPGDELVRRGPYRWIRHPNYVAVVVQLVAIPLALRLPWTAMAILPLKLLALRRRLEIEEGALGLRANRAS